MVRTDLDLGGTSQRQLPRRAGLLCRISEFLHRSIAAVLHTKYRIQNCAARLVTRTRKREHITPVLLQLHWLPVRYRSWYKILLHTLKIMSGQAPVYLNDLVQKHRPVRLLRSEFASLLGVRRTKTVTHCYKLVLRTRTHSH